MLGLTSEMLDELKDELPARVVDVLRLAIGNIDTRLEHDGQVTLAHESPSRIRDQREEIPVPPGASTEVALYIPSYADALFHGHAIGTAKWAKTTAAYRVVANPQSGENEFWAYAQNCTGRDGEDADGILIDIYLPVTGSSVPAIGIGDVIPYWTDVEGNRFSFVSAPSEGGMWFKASTNWAIDGDDLHWVTANIVDNKAGDNPGTEVTLYLPCSPGEDANVYTGDVLPGKIMSDGTYQATGGYQDQKVDTILLWKKIDGGGNLLAVPRGWHLCDGSDSTWDLRALMPVGYKSGDSEYGFMGADYGSHPITPYRHAHTDAGGTYAPNTWNDSNWTFSDHSATATTADATGVTIPAYVGDSATTALSITGSNNTGSTTLAPSGSVTASAKSTGITVDDHASHTHSLATCDVNNSVYVAGTSFSWLSPDQVSETGAHGPQTHTVNENDHDHTIVNTLVFGDGTGATNVHLHTVDFTGATVSPEPHKHGINHSHTPTDPTHDHDTPVLSHTGTFDHRQEDFRPPQIVVAFMQRIAAP